MKARPCLSRWCSHMLDASRCKHTHHVGQLLHVNAAASFHWSVAHPNLSTVALSSGMLRLTRLGAWQTACTCKPSSKPPPQLSMLPGISLTCWQTCMPSSPSPTVRQLQLLPRACALWPRPMLASVCLLHNWSPVSSISSSGKTCSAATQSQRPHCRPSCQHHLTTSTCC